METITVATSRGFSVSEMEMLIGTVIVLAAVAWMVLSKMRHLRGRHRAPSPSAQ
jgi:hypothetical protein